MDGAAISMVTSSIATAIDLAKALTGVRDGALIAEKTAALYDKLLQAQQALLAHNAAMFELQTQYFEAAEQLRKAKEALSERSRYTLVTLGDGYVAYRVNVAPEQGGAGQPGSPEPAHYVCQACFDVGRKVVLQPYLVFGARCGLECKVCNQQIPVNEP